MEAGIYIRVSTSGQEDDFSLTAQEDACRAYAEELAFFVAEENVFPDYQSDIRPGESDDASDLEDGEGE